MRNFPDNTEKDLYRLLVDDYGFKEKLESYPINRWHRLRKKLGLKHKVKKYKAYDMWLTNEIDGKVYEIILVDIWYTLLKIDDVPVFNERRFERESLLKHIPVPYHMRGSVASKSLGIL